MTGSQKPTSRRKRRESQLQAAYLYFEYLRSLESSGEEREIYSLLAKESRRQLLHRESSRQDAA